MLCHSQHKINLHPPRSVIFPFFSFCGTMTSMVFPMVFNTCDVTPSFQETLLCYVTLFLWKPSGSNELSVPHSLLALQSWRRDRQFITTDTCPKIEQFNPNSFSVIFIHFVPNSHCTFADLPWHTNVQCHSQLKITVLHKLY